MKRHRKETTLFPKAVPITIMNEHGSIPLSYQNKEYVQLQEEEEEAAG